MRSNGAVGTLLGKAGRSVKASERRGEGEWSECGMLLSVVRSEFPYERADAFSKYIKWTEVDTGCRCGSATENAG